MKVSILLISGSRIDTTSKLSDFSASFNVENLKKNFFVNLILKKLFSKKAQSAVKMCSNTLIYVVILYCKRRRQEEVEQTN